MKVGANEVDKKQKEKDKHREREKAHQNGNIIKRNGKILI
jgi:hypothetical protein